MSKAEYWQRGEAIDFTNSTDEKIETNQIVVFGSRLGVAGAPIEVGETGALLVTGVFEMPKSSANAIEAGTPVYFDGTGITETEGDDTVTAGYTTAAAAADDTTIIVKLLG